MEKFFTSKYDRVFRSIFIDDDDHHLLEALLSKCLDKDVKIIKLLKTELGVNSTKERVKRLDLIVETNGEKINVELNTSFNNATRVRNFNYFTSFYSSNTQIGEIYDYKTDFIHLDLSYQMGTSAPLIDEYYVYSKKYDNKYVDNFKLIVFNMDKIMKFWYDNNEKMIKKYDLFMMLDLNKEELSSLRKISSNKVIINEYTKKVCKLNEDYDFLAPISAEQDYIMLMNTEKQMAVEEGHAEGYNIGVKEGVKEGIKEGIKQGIEQGTMQRNAEIIKNMQKSSLTKEQILEYLNIDEAEYNRIISNME